MVVTPSEDTNENGRNFDDAISYSSTLEYLINAHVHLFILKKKSILCGLIRSCALINFRENLALCGVFYLIALVSFTYTLCAYQILFAY